MIVAKFGGSLGSGRDTVCADVAELVRRGDCVVLAHGGSADTNAISEQLGRPPRFVTSDSGHVSRYSDRETLEIYAMVVAGRVNKLLVERLQQVGVNALGLCGLDGRLLEGTRKDTLRIIENGKRKILRGDYSGVVEKVNTALLEMLLGAGYTPVIAPVAISAQSEALNVDGDRAAAAVAAALKAETLIIVSNVPGLLKRFPDESSLISRIPRAQAGQYLEQYAQGRMKKKMLGAVEALQQGVKRVIIADGRVDQPLQRALAGQGTTIE